MTAFADWLEKRRRCKSAVFAALESVNPAIRCKGSFLRGDFHLSASTGEVYSDVDCYLADGSLDRHLWEVRIADALAADGFDIRVSVQNIETTKYLSPRQSALLSVGELLRFKSELETPCFAAYLLAKIVLRTVHSYGVPAGDLPKNWKSNAIASRTGADCSVNSGFVEDVYANLDLSDVLLQTHLLLMTQRPPAGVREWFLEQLSVENIHPWLVSRYGQLIK